MYCWMPVEQEETGLWGFWPTTTDRPISLFSTDICISTTEQKVQYRGINLLLFVHCEIQRRSTASTPTPPPHWCTDRTRTFSSCIACCLRRRSFSVCWDNINRRSEVQKIYSRCSRRTSFRDESADPRGMALLATDAHASFVTKTVAVAKINVTVMSTCWLFVGWYRKLHGCCCLFVLLSHWLFWWFWLFLLINILWWLLCFSHNRVVSCRVVERARVDETRWDDAWI